MSFGPKSSFDVGSEPWIVIEVLCSFCQRAVLYLNFNLPPLGLTVCVGRGLGSVRLRVEAAMERMRSRMYYLKQALLLNLRINFLLGRVYKCLGVGIFWTSRCRFPIHSRISWGLRLSICSFTWQGGGWKFLWIAGGWGFASSCNAI
jgi:hypothetical protein